MSYNYYPTAEYMTKKLIISGVFVELFEYAESVRWGFRRLSKPRRKAIKLSQEARQEQLRENNIFRSRSKIRRLIRANDDMDKFITLTFAENVEDFVVANRLFKQFIQRLRRKYLDFKYLAIPEFQERGAIHYHLLSNLSFVPASELAAIWGNGFIKVNKVQNVYSLSMYVSSYLTKNLIDIRYFGKQKFFYSNNLNQPLVFKIWKEIREFMSEWFVYLEELCSSEMALDWIGKVRYTLYGFNSG